MQVVDHRHQVLGRAVASGRGEVAGDLVAPRPVERVLHHRHQLDVGEAVRERMLGERATDLAVVREPPLGRDRAPPGPEVHLVDRARLRRLRGLGAPGEPVGVVEVVHSVVDDRGGRRGHLGAPGERIRLVEHLAVGGPEPELVAVAVPDARDPTGPHAARSDRFERVVAVGAPPVVVTDDARRDGVRCPHGEGRALRVGVRAEAGLGTHVGALVPVPERSGLRCGRRHGVLLESTWVSSARIGTDSRAGRWRSSYNVSYAAFSSRWATSRARICSGSSGSSSEPASSSR